MTQRTPKVRDWAKDIVDGTGTVKIDGVEYTYFELPDELEPSITGFFGFSYHEEGDGNHYFLFLASGVPAEFRQYMLAHEVREELDEHAFGGCRRALTKELEEIPPDLLEAYLAYRLRTFEHLDVYYASKRDQGENAALHDGILESLSVLQGLVHKAP